MGGFSAGSARRRPLWALASWLLKSSLVRSASRPFFPSLSLTHRHTHTHTHCCLFFPLFLSPIIFLFPRLLFLFTLSLSLSLSLSPILFVLSLLPMRGLSCFSSRPWSVSPLAHSLSRMGSSSPSPYSVPLASSVSLSLSLSPSLSLKVIIARVSHSHTLSLTNMHTLSHAPHPVPPCGELFERRRRRRRNADWSTLNPKPSTPNPKPQPQTPNPKPPNPKPAWEAAAAAAQCRVVNARFGVVLSPKVLMPHPSLLPVLARVFAGRVCLSVLIRVFFQCALAFFCQCSSESLHSPLA